MSDRPDTDTRETRLIKLALVSVQQRLKSEADTAFERSRRLREANVGPGDSFSGDGDAHYELGLCEGNHSAFAMAARELGKVVEAL